MDKDKVLPLKAAWAATDPKSRIEYYAARAQRDADWEKVEKLIELIRDLASLLRDFGGSQEERRSSMYRLAAEALDRADAVEDEAGIKPGPASPVKEG